MTSNFLIWVRCRVLGTALFAFSMATTANAAPAEEVGDGWYPPLKKGLWEIFNSNSQYAGHTTTELRCVGAVDQEKQTSKKEYLEETKYCRMAVLEASADKVEQRGECKQEGVTATVGVVYQGNFSHNFERRARSSFSVGTRSEVTTQLKKYRFVGMCPKGMLPGETTTIGSKNEIVAEWNRYTGHFKPFKNSVRLELRKLVAP
jgi:hypothetical protein